MSTPHDPDRQFDDNLRVLGSRLPVPEEVSDELRSRCLAALRFSDGSSGRSTLRALKRPALLSTLGLAACLAVAVGLLFPSNGGPTVEAATILAKFNEQIAEPELIEVTFDSITIEEVSLDGLLQVSDSGVAGDLRIVIREEAEEDSLELDLALGLSPDQSWVLIRKLQIPDPDVQPVLRWLFPPGVETLILLPDDAAVEGLDIDIAEALGELSSAKLVEAFRGLAQNQPDSGASIVEQPDGTLLMTLPIQDAQALEDLIRAAAEAADEDIEISGDEGDTDIDEDNELIGSTLEIVYDPTADLVRSFALTDFGEAKGTLSVVISGKDLDPRLFDADRVTTPNTRTLDLAALESLLSGLGDNNDE